MIKSQLLLAVLSCLIALSFTRNAGPAETAKPVVVMIDHQASGFVYKINSIPVPVSKGLLHTLTFMKEPHSESILLVNEDANISMLIDAYGIMNKAGFVHPRIFYFDRHRDWMAEWTPSDSVPFSTDGHAPSK